MYLQLTTIVQLVCMKELGSQAARHVSTPPSSSAVGLNSTLLVVTPPSGVV